MHHPALVIQTQRLLVPCSPHRGSVTIVLCSARVQIELKRYAISSVISASNTYICGIGVHTAIAHTIATTVRLL
jgi:hypothetical protein